MRKLPHLLAALAVVGVSGMAMATEVMGPFESPEPGSRMADYMSLDRVRSEFQAIADAHADAAGVQCAETGELALHDVYAIQPVILGEGQEHPSAGLWVYRYSITRCGKRQGLQAIGVVLGEPTPRIVYSQAGDTLADPVVQKDMLDVSGHAIAFPQTGLETCDNFMVVDTTVDVPPYDLPAGSGHGQEIDVQAKRVTVNAGFTPAVEQAEVVVVWEEEWTLRYCGQDVSIAVEFWENPYIFGAVGFTVAPPKDG